MRERLGGFLFAGRPHVGTGLRVWAAPFVLGREESPSQHPREQPSRGLRAPQKSPHVAARRFPGAALGCFCWLWAGSSSCRGLGPSFLYRDGCPRQQCAFEVFSVCAECFHFTA